MQKKLLPLLFLFLAACSTGKQVKTELYFGRDNDEGGVTDEQWTAFRNQTLAPVMTGFTEVDAKGYWIGEGNKVYNESSKVIIYVHEATPAEESKLDSLIQVYKTQFDQEAVLQIDQKVRFTFK